MKIKKSNIDLFIAKYFDGATTLKEERLLIKYFQNKNMPEHLEIYRPIFMFFWSATKRKHRVKYLFASLKSKSIAVAVACFTVLLGTALFFNIHADFETSIAYINGKKYTDKNIICSEIIESLNNLSASNTNAYLDQIEAIEQFFDNN
ncbi:MAG: hypothetical protein LBP63_06375 [Prevotellaceae bacterium]|jgi:hypothetical protein|nr:hypothetical protein [Prevotellaceae bacterium]